MKFNFNRKQKFLISYLINGLSDFRTTKEEREYLLGSELVRVNRTIFLNPEQEEFSFDSKGYTKDELIEILNKGYLAHKDFLEQQIEDCKKELLTMPPKYREMRKLIKENKQEE